MKVFVFFHIDTMASDLSLVYAAMKTRIWKCPAWSSKAQLNGVEIGITLKNLFLCRVRKRLGDGCLFYTIERLLVTGGRAWRGVRFGKSYPISSLRDLTTKEQLLPIGCFLSWPLLSHLSLWNWKGFWATSNSTFIKKQLIREWI